jgi:hypothetical protein
VDENMQFNFIHVPTDSFQAGKKQNNKENLIKWMKEQGV